MNNHPHAKIHVLQIVGDPVGGIRKHVHAILLGLDQERFSVSYIFSRTHQDAAFVQDLVQIQKRCQAALELTIHKKPGFSDLANIIKIIVFIKRYGVDQVHGHGAKGGLYARIAGKLAGVKTIYTPHGGALHHVFKKTEKKLYDSVERVLFRLTNTLVFESHYSYEAYRQVVRKELPSFVVNHNGIEIPDLSAVEQAAAEMTLKHSETVGLNAGIFAALRAEKGQALALRVVVRLREQGYLVGLHLFGSGPDRESLEALVRELQLQDCVFWYGDVAEPLAYMQKMDLIWIPSLWESFGYVALEAMSLRKPVLAADTGGLKEVVDPKCSDSARVAAGDVEAMADQLMAFIQAGRHFNSEVDSREYVRRNFTLTTMIGRLQKVYSGHWALC